MLKRIIFVSLIIMLLGAGLFISNIDSNPIVDVYKYSYATVRLRASLPRYQQKVARLKIAKTEWSDKDVINWFKGSKEKYTNTALDEEIIILDKGKKGGIVLSETKNKRFVSYYANRPKNAKYLKPKLSQAQVDKIVEQWLEFRGEKPWDAQISDFKYINNKPAGDNNNSYPIGYSIEYVHEYEDKPIIDNLIKLELIDNKVVSYYRKWYRLIGKQTPHSKIISPDTALKQLGRSLSDSKNGYVSLDVDSIELAYYNPNLYFGENKEGDVLYPAWKITTSNDHFIVDAQSGEIKQKM